MNREDGFPIADIDVGLFHDQKVLALARRLRDDRATAASVSLYLNLVLQSWAAGDRLTLDEAIPAWWMADLDGIRGDLRAVDLVDDESRIPVDAWTSWFVPAFDRREKRRQGGAEGGRRSWQSRRDKRSQSLAEGDLKPSRSRGSAEPNPSVRPADRPTDSPAGRSSREATPPPADADAPASSSPGREPETASTSALWWPAGGPKPATLEEAQSNVRTAVRQGYRPADGRVRRAESLVREFSIPGVSVPTEGGDLQ